MKKFLLLILLILFNPITAQAAEEICLEFDENFQRLTINDTLHKNLENENNKNTDETSENAFENSPINDTDLLDNSPALLEEIPILKEATIVEQENKLFNTFNNQLTRLNNLNIEQTNTVSSLFKEPLTKHFKTGIVESIHPWAVTQFNMDSTFPQSKRAFTKFDLSLVNVLLDGKFRGGKDSFRILLDASHQHNHTFMKQFVQDAYIETKRIPHHSIMIGRSRTGIGYESIQSPYTLPLANRSQISRNFGNIRKIGVRVLGNYSLVDYDIGGYSSDTFYTEFMPGAEFDAWLNLKPLAKTNGKYGKLTTGAGIISGKRNSTDYFISGAYIGYEYKKFWTRMEYATANGSNGATGLSSKHRQGWYVTLGYKITKKLEAIARYDEFNPDCSTRNNHNREYTAGINYYIKGQALKLIMNYIFCQNTNQKNSHRILIGAQLAI